METIVTNKKGTFTVVQDNLKSGRDSYLVTNGKSNSQYRVTYRGSGDADPDYVALWSCTCPAYEHGRGVDSDGCCKHINAVIQATDEDA